MDVGRSCAGLPVLRRPVGTHTALFAIYSAALVVMLIVFGNVSDYTRRRPAILIGMSGGLLIMKTRI